MNTLTTWQLNANMVIIMFLHCEASQSVNVPFKISISFKWKSLYSSIVTKINMAHYKSCLCRFFCNSPYQEGGKYEHNGQGRANMFADSACAIENFAEKCV